MRPRAHRREHSALTVAQPVTIILRKGASGNLQTVATLTSSATGGQYIWTPPAGLANDNDYALEIRQGNQINYYGPFVVQGASAMASGYPAMSMSSASMSATMSAKYVYNAIHTASRN